MPPRLRTVLFALLWTALILLSGLLVAGVAFGEEGSGWAYLAAAFALFALALLAGAARSWRSRRATAVLSYLEQAVRLNLPLPAMLLAAEASERGALRRRLRDLRQFLEGGEPVGTALAAAVPEMPARAAALADAGERNGVLARALRGLVDDGRAAARRDAGFHAFFRWYPAVITLVMLLAVSFISIFVMPKFREILRDFHTPIPPAAAALIRVSDLAAFLAPALAVFTIIHCLRLLVRIFHGRRGLASYQLAERAAWYVPLWHRVLRDRGLADVCQVMADGLAGGRPADAAVAEAARLRLNPVLRGRVARWATAVAAGTPLHAAAAAASLPPLFVGMIRTASVAGNSPDAFEFLARYYGSRFSRTLILLQAALVPLLAIGFGVIVAWVALSIFTPLTSLIDAVIPTHEVL